MKDGFIKVAAASPAIRVADCAFNAAAISPFITAAADAGVKLLVLPELCLTGYTCGDLFMQKTLQDGVMAGLESLLLQSEDSDLISVLGAPLVWNSKLYNCAVFIQKGKILGVVPKTYLPTYAEFYERRQFTPAPEQNGTMTLLSQTVPFGTKLIFTCETVPNLRIAAEICEDLWVPLPPSTLHAAAGATVVVNPSAGDETIGKAEYRRSLVKNQSARLLCGYVYAGAGEGESTTDMVFAGHSIISENGILLGESTLFAPSRLLVSEIDVDRLSYERTKTTTFPQVNTAGYTLIPFSLDVCRTALTRRIDRRPFVPEDPDGRRERCALILTMQAQGLKKRVEHTNTKTLVVGVSGGLDSCLALLVAVRAVKLLGRSPADVLAVTMPCFGTTERTRKNAQRLSGALGATLREIDITRAVNQQLADIGHDPANHDVTYENAQARERTLVLMQLANQTGGMVIGTGDLSELALGWATYNGDHMSMYGVNSSVPKTLIRHIVSYAAQTAADEELRDILQDILNTPVSPELLPPENGVIAQKTEQLVGPYDLHDFFLYYTVRFGFTPQKIRRLCRLAFAGEYEDAEIDQWLTVFCRRFFTQQFKRSCLPDGPKIGSVTLSPRGDWRMPSDASPALWLNDAAE